MDGWHADTGGVWTDRVSRSRRASGTPRPFPPRTPTPWTRACPPSALELTPEARAAIDGHARLLLAWTAAINLTAIREPAAVAVGHVVDSLTAVRVLRERGADRSIDLGSGGGYPGIPLAAALPARPDAAPRADRQEGRVPVRRAVAATGLDDTVEAAPVRAEALAADPRHRGRWPAVTARAVASLADLVELAFPLLEPGGCLVAWKRGDIGAGAGCRGPGGRRARRGHAGGPGGRRSRARRASAGRRHGSRPRPGRVPA